MNHILENVLNEESVAGHARTLALRHPEFDSILGEFGVPPLWEKPQTFATLIDIILGQQVSLESAKACFQKLEALIGTISPENYLSLSDEELRSCGFSRQKTGYGRNVANAILEGTLDLDGLRNLPDAEVKTELEKIKGIGNWTSDIYLLMAMLRPDVMPKGDLALHISWQEVSGRETRPKSDEFLEIAEAWAPYRSTASRLLWHSYLSRRGKKWEG